jgi:hypothetical protein
LLLWSDPSGAAQALRRRYAAAFPGAPARQPRTLHSSLLRIVTAKPLGEGDATTLAAEARRWTEKVGAVGCWFDVGRGRVEVRMQTAAVPKLTSSSVHAI